ncbi:ABC transporter ATP-binding protein [Xaviernesmea oryzae]|uniref:ABC transporter ATP-binding protein n=1 Tax=Xaviernesmea oryzae TaxID=464029 RepID=A0A1Q9B0W4_9HYPH|nr:ABC transporter ATP-binding protein [Xaviernesmea oryzae]OLP61621.1 ABC transporter ATP-binding protein [Xaviernesmea oryzae]SEL05996.1 multiple sugar transport system ATP-binding protein [Xaviernesmea oryzae]
MAEITFENVSKTYPGGKAAALTDFNLRIEDGEFIVLVGPSGCGKTTALRMIAGLEDISGGTLRINDKVANDLAPRDRDIAMVFQSYALYPHLTVAENIAFGLKVRGAKPEVIEKKVRETAELLELTEFLERKPARLSGGQRQRVAMGRALVRSPNAFLMDEPLSNLDARLRGQMRAEIARLQRLSAVTTVYVTHDQVEAMTMGHRVAVMNRGTLQQLDTPRHLYDKPANMFVASFIGSPPINFMEGELTAHEGGPALACGPLMLPLGEAGRRLSSRRPGKVILGMRPEHMKIAPEAGSGTFGARAAFVEDLGATLLLHMDEHGIAIGHANMVEDDRDLMTTVPKLKALVDSSHRIQRDDRVHLTIDPALILLFDPATGAAV